MKKDALTVVPPRKSTSLSETERQVRDASRARRDSGKNALRASIVSAAAEVFLEKGYEDFSMRQVAARIGYSATTIYHHFLNKEDLLKAVLAMAFTKFDAALLEAVEAETEPSRRMGALGKAFVRFGVAHPVHYQLMYLHRPNWLEADDGNPAKIAQRSSYGLLLAGVVEAVEKGWLPQADPRVLADWMWATVHGLVMLGITEFRDDPARLEAAMTLFDLAPQNHQPAPCTSRNHQQPSSHGADS